MCKHMKDLFCYTLAGRVFFHNETTASDYAIPSKRIAGRAEKSFRARRLLFKSTLLY